MTNPTAIDDNRSQAAMTPRRAWALALLADARAAAEETANDPWEFAVEISSFLAAGLTVNDMRWLSAIGYLRHAVETTQAKDAVRTFVRSKNLSFPERTCFVATEAGLRAAEPCDELSPAMSKPIRCFPAFKSEVENNDLVPSWDRNRRTLRLGDKIVKRFRVPSPSQEAILIAFEEEGWPAAIYDPLPPHPMQDAKRRLRATLQSLNGGQSHRLVRFRGDGSGERIVWELTAVAVEMHIPEQSRHRRAA